jgi:outer membrane protein OmpA-like peptidoglycan-associated protein
MRIQASIIAAGLIGGLSTAAVAQTNGWYAGAETGLNVVTDTKLKSVDGKRKDTNDLGYGIVAEGGYGFGAVRVGGELGWRSNGTDKLAGTTGRGGIDALSAMANVYYDFNTGTAWTPYLGVGAGGADLEANKIRNSTATYAKKDDFVFAYQGIAGVSYALNDNLSIKGDYRYFRTTQAEFKDPAIPGTKSKMDYAAHAIMVGFTYKFGVAQPAPVPVAAPAPMPAPMPAPAPKPVAQAPIAKSYLVFFDFDKSNITPEAQKIIEQAATNAKSSNTTSINLVGHTDAAGSEKYNMALSLRRGNAVKAALVKLGIPADEISVVGKGKTELLVPTKDGVREPQNRRVQILL